MPVPPMLQAIWERNLPLVHGRVDHLCHAAESALMGTLTAEDHTLALTNAHKLAGSLGTFGFPAAGKLAHAMELLLEAPAPVDGLRLSRLAADLRSTLHLPEAPSQPHN